MIRERMCYIEQNGSHVRNFAAAKKEGETVDCRHIVRPFHANLPTSMATHGFFAQLSIQDEL